MELRQYLKILRKNFVFVLTTSVLGAMLAILVTRSMPSGYQMGQTFFLSQPEGESAPLPEYYAQEKARNFTDTAVAILDSPDFRQKVVSSGQDLKVRKIAPQVIRITATAQSSQSAQELMAKATNAFNSKLAALGQNQKEGLQLKEISTSQEPEPKVVDKKVFAISGLILGFAAAIAAISLKAYFRL